MADEASYEFPGDFLWGAATSAYQVEGAAEEHGKKKSQQDVLNVKPGWADAAVASDHYHRYKQDVALMKELGLTSYRFSIAWSRIFPDGIGDVNHEGVQFYHDLIDELLANGIEPLPTLYHYDLPLALVEKYDGWIDRQVVEDWASYSEFVIKEYGSKVKYWLTINEQSIIVQYWTSKNLIPDRFLDDPQIKYQINHHMNLAQAISVKQVHELFPGSRAGAALGYSAIYPISGSSEDNFAALNANALRNYYYTDVYFKGRYDVAAQRYLERNGLAPRIEPGDDDLLAAGISDFLALNYYASESATTAPVGVPSRTNGLNASGIKGQMDGYEVQAGFYAMTHNPTLDTTDWDWAIDPRGLEYVLRDLYGRYGKPLMITENGLGAYDTLGEDGSIHDLARIDYLREHVKAMWRAMDSGAEVWSYNPWSFVDVLSSSNGYKKRYGLVYVDRTDDDLGTLERHKKDSFYWYQEVIRTGGRSLRD